MEILIELLKLLVVMKKILPLLIICLNFHIAFGQKVLPTSHPIHQEVNKVYQQLTNAIGDFGGNLPQLQILEDRKAYGASYHKGENKLNFEKTLYDVCQSMGDQSSTAIAFIIGHELAHYYQDHHWSEAGFGTSFLMNNETFNKNVEEEKLADTYGAFVCRQAGYNPSDIAFSLFDKIYEAYGWEEGNMEKYPPLATRKQVVLDIKEKVENLLDLYDAANYLSLAGRFDLASLCYQYILEFVRTQELYNNLATAQLAAATLMPKAGEVFFAYPLEIDLKKPVRQGSAATREQLLSGAMHNLNAALNFDRNYFPALLNSVNANILKNKLDLAEKQLSSLKQKFSNSNEKLAKINLAKGILTAKQNHTEQAHNFFKAAKKMTGDRAIKEQANYNLAVLSGKEQSERGGLYFSLEDQIEGLDLNLLPNVELTHFTSIKDHSGSFEYSIDYKRFSRSSVFFQFSYPFDSPMVLHQNYNRNYATTRGIRIGDDIEKVEKAYSNKNVFILNSRSGHLRYYKQLGLMFKIGNNNRVEGWAVFAG